MPVFSDTCAMHLLCLSRSTFSALASWQEKLDQRMSLLRGTCFGSPSSPSFAWLFTAVSSIEWNTNKSGLREFCLQNFLLIGLQSHAASC